MAGEGGGKRKKRDLDTPLEAQDRWRKGSRLRVFRCVGSTYACPQPPGVRASVRGRTRPCVDVTEQVSTYRIAKFEVQDGVVGTGWAWIDGWVVWEG